MRPHLKGQGRELKLLFCSGPLRWMLLQQARQLKMAHAAGEVAVPCDSPQQHHVWPPVSCARLQNPLPSVCIIRTQSG